MPNPDRWTRHDAAVAAMLAAVLLAVALIGASVAVCAQTRAAYADVTHAAPQADPNPR